jgi:hypothetical protein
MQHLDLRGRVRRATDGPLHNLSISFRKFTGRLDTCRQKRSANRSLPRPELDAFVDALAVRIASFDKQAIADTKRLVDVASLPSDAEISLEWDAFIAPR